MFQTYAIIGSALAITGIIYTYYFVRYILTYKAETFSVVSLSDSLVTVFIGVFYIYSAIILSRGSNHAVFNFTNNIDDIVTINTEGYFNPGTEESTTKLYENEDINVYIPTTDSYNFKPENGQTEDNANEKVTEYIENENTSDMVESATFSTTTESAEKDDVLASFQNYMKNVIKQKISNSSFYNRTIFYNNKEYRSLKNRTKRDVKTEKTNMTDDDCFKEIFISNALFLYSFVHCSLTLIQHTLLCNKNDENTTGTDPKGEDSNASNELNDSNSEKNENSAPIGPLFNNPERSEDTIKEIFKARSIHSLKKVTTETTNTVDMKDDRLEKLKLTGYILVMWILPATSVAIFYGILSYQSTEMEQSTNYLNTLTLNSTQASPELVNIIQNATNITPVKESTEVNNILKNVYSIVNEAKQQNTNNRAPYFSAPMMKDIVYFLNHQYRNPKDYEENCSIGEMSLKIYIFIYVVAYILIILYAKIKHATRSSQNGRAYDKLNMCILAFSFLWLPSVLELFFRIFLTQTKPSMLTDIFLTLGNTNRLFTMATDYNKSKKLINKLIVVEPVV